MKKILLFVLLAFSINAFAQHNQRSHPTKQSVLNPIEIVKSIRDIKSLKASGVFTSEKINEFIKAIQAPAVQYELLDSVRHWDWDIQIGNWVNTNKTVKIMYDGKNRIISSIQQEWDTDSWEWINSVKSTYIYNSSDLMTTMLMEGWEDTEWVNVMRTTMTYDTNKDQTSLKTEMWFMGIIMTTLTTLTYDANHNVLTEITQTEMLGPLTNVSKEIFTYDTNNNLLTAIHQAWETDSWVNDTYTVNTYDSHDNLLTTTNQNWETGAWINADKRTFTYDANDNNTVVLSQIWQSSAWENNKQWISTFDARHNETSFTEQNWVAGAWLNNSKNTYTYNGTDDMLTDLHQNWSVNNWVNDVQSTYTYDANGNNTRIVFQSWLNNAWYRSALEVETFDSNNFPVTHSNKLFNEDGITVSSGDSARYYYRPATGVYNLEDEQLTVYPNPSKGKITISSTEKIIGFEIYNSVGEVIISELKTNNQSKSIDLSNYSKGIYVIRMNTGNKSYTKKIILK